MVTLTPGQTFYEGPNDVHAVGRNASTTKPAKFVVVMVKKKVVQKELLTPETRNDKRAVRKALYAHFDRTL